ncbi:recombinase family protein [Siminovitchia sediminis]|uniref:Recombinase family protein n=1 Tax=Siminovitchia sediminis TaxID=1274353 RepID=A0ABW4KP01_9BACI
MIIGYARVSSKDQNLARQVEELEEFGCEKIFTEKKSGNSFKERAIYYNMRKKLRFGDVLVVHDLSRFGRNKQDIKDEWESLMKDDIDIVVLNMPILDTRKYKELKGVGQLITEIVLSLLSWMVEEERERIRTAQREGIEIAKKKGKYKGRKKKYHAGAAGKDKIIYDEIVKELKVGISVMDIHRKTGVARSTIYSIKDELLTSSVNAQ